MNPTNQWVTSINLVLGYTTLLFAYLQNYLEKGSVCFPFPFADHTFRRNKPKFRLYDCHLLYMSWNYTHIRKCWFSLNLSSDPMKGSVIDSEWYNSFCVPYYLHFQFPISTPNPAIPTWDSQKKYINKGSWTVSVLYLSPTLDILLISEGYQEKSSRSSNSWNCHWHLLQGPVHQKLWSSFTGQSK